MLDLNTKIESEWSESPQACDTTQNTKYETAENKWCAHANNSQKLKIQ